MDKCNFSIMMIIPCILFLVIDKYVVRLHVNLLRLAGYYVTDENNIFLTCVYYFWIDSSKRRKGCIHRSL